MKVRSNKFLAETGIASRRKSEEFIRQGRVTVNNKVVTDLSCFVNTETDVVFLDGEKVKPNKNIYILLNKPKGVITSVSDERNRKTVFDLVKSNLRIFPVGRLDYNTTGVLLLTNDGMFSQLLTHPGNKVPKEYEVQIDKNLTDTDRQKLLEGIYLEGKKGRFNSILFRKSKDYKNITITCVEGRNRFVKKMFGALGYTVINLSRSAFAGIRPDIPVGHFRPLTNIEIKKIYTDYSKK